MWRQGLSPKWQDEITDETLIYHQAERSTGTQKTVTLLNLKAEFDNEPKVQQAPVNNYVL